MVNWRNSLLCLYQNVGGKGKKHSNKNYLSPLWSGSNRFKIWCRSKGLCTIRLMRLTQVSELKKFLLLCTLHPLNWISLLLNLHCKFSYLTLWLKLQFFVQNIICFFRPKILRHHSTYRKIANSSTFYLEAAQKSTKI